MTVNLKAGCVTTPSNARGRRRTIEAAMKLPCTTTTSMLDQTVAVRLTTDEVPRPL